MKIICMTVFRAEVMVVWLCCVITSELVWCWSVSPVLMSKEVRNSCHSLHIAKIGAEH